MVFFSPKGYPICKLEITRIARKKINWSRGRNWHIVALFFLKFLTIGFFGKEVVGLDKKYPNFCLNHWLQWDWKLTQATVKIFTSSPIIRCLNCGFGNMTLEIILSTFRSPKPGGGGGLVRYNLGRALPLRKWTYFYTKLNQTSDPHLYQKSHFSAKLIIILKTFSKIPVIFEKLDSKFMIFWPVSWQLKFEKTLKSDPMFKNKKS